MTRAFASFAPDDDRDLDSDGGNLWPLDHADDRGFDDHFGQPEEGEGA